MKILVLSDSHGSMQTMIDAIFIEKPDCIIHLGDHIRDADRLSELYPQISMICVPGNCDYMDNGPGHLVRELDGVRFLITHGHKYGVKTDLTRLTYAAMEAEASVAVFGHTHRAVLHEFDDRLVLFNPGSCGAGEGSYGIIQTNHGVPTFLISSTR